MRYRETNWKYEKGLETHSNELTFNRVSSQDAIGEQRKRTERLSLVKFIGGAVRAELIDICHNFKLNDKCFFFDEDKKFHVTLVGFSPIASDYYDRITQKIDDFIALTQTDLNVRFDMIRLGTKYEKKDCLKPVYGVSNGIVIAFGNSTSNKKFNVYGNKLISFLIRDRNLSTVMGKTFRRRFPTVWCTMGYYTRDFTITKKLEALFSKYDNLDKSIFTIPCFELELGLSHYKDLRDWKPLKRFVLLKESR
jgi:hypothetical protein